jgi:hypothetical protein
MTHEYLYICVSMSNLILMKVFFEHLTDFYGVLSDEIHILMVYWFFWVFIWELSDCQGNYFVIDVKLLFWGNVERGWRVKENH